MIGEPVPPDKTNNVDETITSALGMHGPWVMAVEVYDDSGEPTLMVCWSDHGTHWQKLGMAHALVEDLSIVFRRNDE